MSPTATFELPVKNEKPWRFYVILVSLSFITFIASLDGSITATALPQISAELSAADQYVWIANSFLVAQTVVQPPCAQLCNIFGRRTPLLVALVVFALGSGIAGGASNSAMLVAGRTIQGAGSGGLMMLVELIICDLVSVRERGKYLGMVMSTSAIGAITGPVVGGALAVADWRWIFYMNIPISSVIIVIMLVFLRLQHEKASSWHKALARVDWIGNVVFISALCSLLIGLVFGGDVFPWSSWRVILPIVLGVCGWTAFHVYESMPPSFCPEPSVPSRIFGNRTSAAAFHVDFISSVLLQWVCFFWPVYFQGIHETTPLRAGINFIPFEAFLIITAAVAGGMLSRFGHYRPIHLLGFCLGMIGPGLNIMLSRSTPKAVWVVFQMIDAIGRGLLLPTVLPAIMASLPDSDTAAATGMYSFLRSFGFVWGVTIPGTIFNAQFDRHASRISDATVRQELGSGRAYQYVSGSYIKVLSPTVQHEVLSVYQDALKAVWIAAVAFGATGFVAVATERHIPLRTELDTKYGLEEEKSGGGGGEKDA
ncbi:putative macrolide phosphotransferase k [Mytilinidion resinicola]|uniref:Macrolide phosphotransferase k n=1 Tax=Mytilinidion resinicola TaxID=574789 RepID=A0A6A6Y066_9PEZI|nr:putative macrolide phosphotransferase k [Mytilinidion resinicola]KAF2802039.1 putative macrolide phosphotransferase k [Mytilinidion resinicola]